MMTLMFFLIQMETTLFAGTIWVLQKKVSHTQEVVLVDKDKMNITYEINCIQMSLNI